MKTVGEILVEARNKKNLSLEQVERETRIRKKILEKLEKSDWSLFAPTYAKGLLRNYASFLGLDETKVLAFFRREFDERKQDTTGRKLAKINPKFRLTPAVVSITVVIILVVAIFTYLFYQYRSFTAAPVLEVHQPKNNERVEDTEVSVVGRTLDDSILKINGEEVQVSPGGTFSVTVNLRVGVNTLTITSANRFGKINTIERTVVVDPKEDLVNKNTQVGELVNLTLRIAERPTFLKIEIDGDVVFQGLMLSGSEKTFEASEKIKITTEDAGATFVKIGKEETPLGNEGEKVEREFTTADL